MEYKKEMREGMLVSQLEKDYKYCEEIIKKESKSFYFAFSKLPRTKAKGVYAIYAFNRMVDDSVDEVDDGSIKKQLLDKHKEDLLNMNQVDEPIYRALTDTFSRYQCIKDPYFEQIKGQEMDIDFEQPENMEVLEKYSDYVAGSVGRMMLPIIASENENLEGLYPAATDLGVAMQLTNILRDVGEDYRERQRIYLPKSLMKKYGYTEEELAENKINDNFMQMWEHVAYRSEELYKVFFNSIDEFDKDSVKQIHKSAKVYHEILEVIREKEYNCLIERQYVPKCRMLLL